MSNMIGVRVLLSLAALMALLTTMAARPAAAEPATTVSYPANASATRLNGLAFDTCTAPSLTAMRAWLASPYDGVGVYMGGVNRSCTQPNLTASWVSSVSALGWRLVPIYLGRQAPCSTRTYRFTASSAASWGTSDAADAVSRAKALGMLPGSAIYGDMEHYNANDTSCRDAVRRYVSSWTKELHRHGYLAGIYGHLYSGAKHLSESYSSTSYARPDAIWIARWDGSSSLTGWEGIPNAHWSNRQRGKQYLGDHNETHGGVTINIDSDRFDAPVATVAYSYRTTTSLSARRAPSTSSTVVKTYASGATVQVVCQTPGTAVGTSSVWDKLTDGSYVADYYLTTPSSTGYSAPLPRCTYPHQVTATTLNERTGPGVSYATTKTLASGALAWIYCQRSGSTVGTTAVWDRLDDTYYVTDYYVATRSKTTYSTPIPRC